MMRALCITLALMLSATSFARPVKKAGSAKAAKSAKASKSPVANRALVLIDAPAPLKGLVDATLAKKYDTAPTRLSEVPSTYEVAALGSKTGALALVTGRLVGGIYNIAILNAANGELVSSFRFPSPAGKKPLRALPKGIPERLLSGVADTFNAPTTPAEPAPAAAPPPAKEPAPEPASAPAPPPPAAEPAPVAKKKEVAPAPPPVREEPVRVASSEAVEEADSNKQPALLIGGGIRVLGRRFFYTDEIPANSLATYNLPVGPAPMVTLEWFPGAHVASSGVWANLGIAGSFDYLVGVSSVSISDNTRYSTQAYRLKVGAVGRLPLGRLTVSLLGGYFLQHFGVVGTAGQVVPNLATINARGIRTGLGFKVDLASFFGLYGSGAYHFLFGSGDLGSKFYFPRSAGAGLDATAGVSITLGGRLELRLGVDYSRYWYSMYPQVGDPYVAGGATDDSFSGTVQALFRI